MRIFTPIWYEIFSELLSYFSAYIKENKSTSLIHLAKLSINRLHPLDSMSYVFVVSTCPWIDNQSVLHITVITS